MQRAEKGQSPSSGRLEVDHGSTKEMRGPCALRVGVPLYIVRITAAIFGMVVPPIARIADYVVHCSPRVRDTAA